MGLAVSSAPSVPMALALWEFLCLGFLPFSGLFLATLRVTRWV